MYTELKQYTVAELCEGFLNGLWHDESGIAQPVVKGNRVYKRIFIRKIQ